ncbi:MAG: hypothetical protein ACI83P_001777 [Janthinobacterium sp.]
MLQSTDSSAASALIHENVPMTLPFIHRGKYLSFFEDFRSAIDAYDGDHMDVKLVSYQLLGAGTKLNPGEWFRCQVQVFNSGHLDLKGVTVSINSTAYAKVSLTRSSPASSVTVPFGNMAAHSSRQSGAWIYGYATAATGGTKDVISGRIASWDADLSHLLSDHSSWGPLEGKINIEIFPG